MNLREKRFQQSLRNWQRLESFEFNCSQSCKEPHTNLNPTIPLSRFPLTELTGEVEERDMETALKPSFGLW